MKLHEIVEDKKLRAGDIRRHPTHQRKSPLKQFTRKVGPFEIEKCLDPIHVVPDGEGAWYAIDGATRVEACRESVGSDTLLPCRIYGNGEAPSPDELDELFLLLNADKVSVSATVQFERSVGAGRSSALAAKKQIERLGPKFRSTTSVWKLVERYGERCVKQTVDFLIDTWGIKEHIPMQIMTAVCRIMARGEKVQKLRQRKGALKRKTPDNWLLMAQNARLNQIGKRSGVTAFVEKKLLGQR